VTNHLVEGRPLPDHVAGHPALELCNTKALWGLPTEREYFTDFTVAVLWAREHALIAPADARRLRAEPVPKQRVALGQLRALRAALFWAVTKDGPLDVVQSFVSRAVARSDYVRDERGVRLQSPYAIGMIADRSALEAHRLLEDYGTDAVGLCASEACGWVFLDPTHRRRWCTMAVCGNRAKVRRFAERRRTPASVEWL
jgi:predicted RNA-binding Zn ribbon-like protein